jgi:hypothetical protein
MAQTVIDSVTANFCESLHPHFGTVFCHHGRDAGSGAEQGNREVPCNGVRLRLAILAFEVRAFPQTQPRAILSTPEPNQEGVLP